ncbi:peptide synthetase [Xenorhabdus sp. 12]|uniref:Peptide synthetase n=1 Tax=Xenorhabdus santafensis TaxID=2582833 RepID=A0ABU4S4L5_9GAMM|nr:AMP-binding protein [Xenorhabdus sp. 12]MDX7986042.1 peptide synthetase [Xenorhabdus sp. 12]
MTTANHNDINHNNITHNSVNHSHPHSNYIEELLQVTPQANGLLFHALKDGNSAYHIGVAFSLSADIEEDAIRKVWHQIQQAQPALRSVFFWQGIRAPHQLVYALPRVLLEYSRVESAVPSLSMKQRCLDWLAQSKATPFALHSEVFRIVVFHDVGAGTLSIAFSFHHILMDGWSSSLLISLWLQGLRKQKIVPLAARSYAQQLWKGLSQEELVISREYWQNKFQQLPDGEDSAATKLLDEPLFRPSEQAAAIVTTKQDSDGTGRAGNQPTANKVHALWSKARKADIETLCRRAGVTPASFIYLCWAMTLSKFTYQKTVAFGCTFSGRGAALSQNAEHQPLGLFTNTVPLILELNGKWDLETGLRSVFQILQQTQRHEKTPPLTIREEAGTRDELYDSIVVFDNYPIDATLRDENHGAFLTDFHSEETTHFGLTLTVSGVEQWRVELSSGETYEGDPAAVAAVFSAFESLATDLLNQPAEILFENRALRVNSTTEASATGSESSLIAGEIKEDGPDINQFLLRIYQRLNDHPQDIGLIDPQHRISNHTLLAGIAILQERLQEAGFIPGDRVAVHLEKGRLSTQALLAILFSGGSYFYLNPKDPLQRRKQLLALAECRLVLTNSALTRELGSDIERCLLLDIESSGLESSEIEPQAREAGKIHLSHRPSEGEFYFIFTSGTTGTPKGIAIRNGSVANLLDWFIKETSLTSADRVLGLTDLNFDPSVEDLFASLAVGATLIYPSPNVLLERQAFIELVQNESITLIDFIPGAIAQLIQGAPFFPAMRLWVFGGEELPKRLRDDLLQQGYAVSNHYGPSETTVDCLSARQTLASAVSIGWPIQNVVAYCADIFGNPLPAGIRGELWVGGRAVAHGYTTNPVESAKYFVPANHLKDESVLPEYRSLAPHFYRTGDAVAFSHESGFNYLGRIDDQVKVNGVRIEPRELERTVEMLAQVKVCYLLPAAQAGKRQWHLFVDSSESAAILEPRVREHIRRHFPASWEPALIVIVDGFQRTITGKVDRKWLRACAVEWQQAQSAVAPVTLTDPIETQVHEIWCGILETQAIATNVNFFDAGGDSIKIIALQSQMQQAFNLDIGVATLFEHPTIAAFAGWLKQSCLSPEYAASEGTRPDPGNQPSQESTLSSARSGKNRLADRRRKAKGNSAL